jgi:carbon monoxide dehydrogenase subunit G
VAAVNESIEIAAPPSEVWSVIMDPYRLGDWVTAHRKVYDAPNGELEQGDSFKQKLRVVGPSFKVKWSIVEADEPKLAVWEGKGPGGSSADVRYELSETDDGGTRFDYCNDFELPGGPLSLPAKSIAGPPAIKQARATLQNLKELLEK